MDLQKIADALAAPERVDSAQAIVADIAKGRPKDAAEQAALVGRLTALAQTLNAGTVTRQRSVTTMQGVQTSVDEIVPAWTGIGQREVDFGDVLVALGFRWEDLSISNSDETAA